MNVHPELAKMIEQHAEQSHGPKCGRCGEALPATGPARRDYKPEKIVVFYCTQSDCGAVLGVSLNS